MNRRFLVSLTVICLLALPIFAADENLSITADQLNYNGQTGIATATGNVVVTKDNAIMTSAVGDYNVKNDEVTMSGGVIVDRGTMHMTAATVNGYAKNHIQATGDVSMVDKDRQLSGNTVDYQLDTKYGVVTGNAFMKSEGTSLWADHIEGWLDQIKAIGNGNVRIDSPDHGLKATGNQITYTQTPNQNDGIVHLNGNAHAVQNGNTLDGASLEIYLADDSIQTKGRSTLVITPAN